MSWCMHDTCDIDELHEAHDEDFVRRRGGRGPKRTRDSVPRPRVRSDTKAARLAKLSSVTYTSGGAAYVRCPECDGAGCGLCLESGMVPTAVYRRWRSGCG